MKTETQLGSGMILVDDPPLCSVRCPTCGVEASMDARKVPLAYLDVRESVRRLAELHKCEGLTP